MSRHGVRCPRFQIMARIMKINKNGQLFCATIYTSLKASFSNLETFKIELSSLTVTLMKLDLITNTILFQI